MSNCYVLIRNTVYNNDTNISVSSKILGVFKEKNTATEIINRYEELFTPQKNVADDTEVVLEIQEFKYDSLNVDNQEDFDRVTRYNKEKSEAYESLVAQGILDYTIDEDGNFEFSPTEKGLRLIAEEDDIEM